jgi:5-methylthioadenosine/S-adenosylhomocysteine deaminase
VSLRLTAPVVLPCDAECSVLRDAALDIDADGRIAWVGPPPKPRRRRPAVQALPGVLLPGLINTPRAHADDRAARAGRRPAAQKAVAARGHVPAESRLRADDVRAGMAAGCVEPLPHRVHHERRD